MGWLTGKPKAAPVLRDCRTCDGRGWIGQFGLAPGGRLVQTGRDTCGNCNGRGKV